MGCFLASGSVNNPSSKHYHLEITTHSEKHAEFLVKTIAKFNLIAKVIKRRNIYVVYIKKSEEISDFLRVINAANSVMDFEEERISKDYWNCNNRLNICELSNEVKTLQSANKQLEFIEKIILFAINSGRSYCIITLREIKEEGGLLFDNNDNNIIY